MRNRCECFIWLKTCLSYLLIIYLQSCRNLVKACCNIWMFNLNLNNTDKVSITKENAYEEKTFQDLLKIHTFIQKKCIFLMRQKLFGQPHINSHQATSSENLLISGQPCPNHSLDKSLHIFCRIPFLRRSQEVLPSCIIALHAYRTLYHFNLSVLLKLRQSVYTLNNAAKHKQAFVGRPHFIFHMTDVRRGALKFAPSAVSIRQSSVLGTLFLKKKLAETSVIVGVQSVRMTVRPSVRPSLTGIF